MTTNRLCAGGDLELRLEGGSLRLAWNEPDWLGPLSFRIHSHAQWHAFPSSQGHSDLGEPQIDTVRGSDDLGDYVEWQLRWSPQAPVVPSVRAYAQQRLLIFALTAVGALPPDLATGVYSEPSVVWPCFVPAERQPSGAPTEMTSFGYQASEFALPTFADQRAEGFFFVPHRATVIAPMLWIASDLRTMMLAPLDNFHEQIIAVPDERGTRDGSVRCGWHGDLREVPASFRSEMALCAGESPRAVLDQWGALLLRRNRTQRPSRYADELSARLSYWTDNGAVYYYRTAPGCDYTATLEQVVEDLEQRDIPIGSVQIDSWFYPHEELRPVSAEGAPIVPPSGGMLWEPRADLFPAGFGELRQRLRNLPLAFHSRHFSARSPYFQQYRAWVDGEVAHPSDADFYQFLLGQAQAWGAIVYEQDWMVETFSRIRPMRAVAGRARAWQEAMNAAARAHGMHLQWCMSTPADFMQSVSLTELTSIRTSGDYRYLFDNGLNWVWFLHTNALARALGLWPYKDVFLTQSTSQEGMAEPYAEVEAMLASLSAGPVGIGDAVGMTDRDLVLRTCREDGLLLKPDVPIAALDRCFRANGFFAPALLVGETHSSHEAGSWHYVACFNAFQGRTRIADSVAVRDVIGASGAEQFLLWDWRRAEWTRVDRDARWSVELDFQEWDYRVLCPILAGEITVIGDVSKFVTVADRRVDRIRGTERGLSFRVQGRPGAAVSITGWSTRRPKAVERWSGSEGTSSLGESSWSWDPATQIWRLECSVDRGGTALIDIIR